MKKNNFIILASAGKETVHYLFSWTRVGSEEGTFSTPLFYHGKPISPASTLLAAPQPKTYESSLCLATQEGAFHYSNYATLTDSPSDAPPRLI
jgi:hypothetical protein